ncbi:hypothetical protein C8D87_105465 [Lentzea atacamensis]|uniref:Uncharacterized protein n=1 Tax=Lentzea atacamensis TaxID=531938 RepID=A0ABX9E6G6_9PSEU|nr:hypothetical protein C8D87_105465 [Lentzea atacamensis]
MRSRVLIYFVTLLATIALINTPVPRIVVSAVLTPEAGEAVARSLTSITKDLVLVLLISLYFEWVRTREQGELLRGIDRKLELMQEDARTASAPAIRKLVLDTTPPEELVRTALDRHIPHSADKSSFVSMLLSASRPHHDVSVTLRVDRVEEGVLHVSSRYELMMPRGPVMVAATSSPVHAAALASSSPELFEVVTLPRSTPFEEAVRIFGERLECYVEPTQGAVRRAHFRKVPSSALRKHISLPIGMVPSDVSLFIADLSQESTEMVHVRHYYRWTQTIGEHFLFWSAGRPMFVRTITMDLRELVQGNQREVFVQPFLDTVDSLVLDAKDGHLMLRLDRWLVRGQGVVAIW